MKKPRLAECGSLYSLREKQFEYERWRAETAIEALRAIASLQGEDVEHNINTVNLRNEAREALAKLKEAENG